MSNEIEGKRKLYFVQLNSLSEVAQENYLNKLNPDFNDVAVIENIRLGPTLPAFVSSNVLNILVDKFKIKPTTTSEKDLEEIIG